jgi:antitoxin PrlF
MPTATLTSKGQITIPKGVREDLGLKTGDRVEFRKSPGGGVRMEVRRTRLRDLAGLLHRKGRRPLSVREMDDAIARFHSKK